MMGDHGASVEDSGGNIVAFDDAADRLRAIRELRAEANALVEAHGHNAYSDFILRHGRRPDRNQAVAIGRLMGIRVRAADGTLQPRRTKTKQPVAHPVKHQQRTEGDYIDQILRLRCALANLAENKGDPAEVIAYIDPLFGDASVIREQLAHAVQWINRFAEEWGHEQETRGGPRQV
jgi:hypothetical protein